MSMPPTETLRVAQLKRLSETELRLLIRTESLDVEDLRVLQVQLAGHKRRPVCTTYGAVYSGQTWNHGDRLRADIRRLVRQTAEGYSLADALPFFLEFPIEGNLVNAPRFESFFALVLIGPRVETISENRYRRWYRP